MALHTAPATKPCSICGEPKPLAAFAKRTKSADGLQRHCKPCGRQALDAADARRKATARGQLPIATDLDALVALVEARALDVVLALWEAADAGADVLAHLAHSLEPTCPAEADEYSGPFCELHELAFMHYLVVSGQEPATPLPSPTASDEGPDAGA
jgi:hypothetical protein